MIFCEQFLRLKILQFICFEPVSPLQAFETTDFTDVRPLFPPLLHTICLVYSSSKYYNTSARIIVLLTVSLQNCNQQVTICVALGNL